jgi:hypothetical protein
MQQILGRWWFIWPVSAGAVLSTWWLSSALGIEVPLIPFSVPHFVFFVVSMSAFWRLYAWIIWAIVLWSAPRLLGKPGRPILNAHSPRS